MWIGRREVVVVWKFTLTALLVRKVSDKEFISLYGRLKIPCMEFCPKNRTGCLATTFLLKHHKLRLASLQPVRSGYASASRPPKTPSLQTKGRGNFKHASLEMSERAKNCPDLCVFMVYITFFGRLISATLYNAERSLLLSNFGSTTVS